MAHVSKPWLVLLSCWFWGNPVQSLAAGRDFLPANDEVIVQVLGPKVTSSAASSSPQQVHAQVRALIEQSRRAADPRFLGRAEALLRPWWGQPNAPVELMILQATIEQSRHMFDSARASLLRVLKLQPRQAQALLTLATIERVTGNYMLASRYCGQLIVSGAELYGLACLHETRSLTGQEPAAAQALLALASKQLDRSNKAWLLSLAAEHAERSGNDRLAHSLYLASLQNDVDHYTSLALSDLLLRGGDARAALAVLKALPDSDAVLLRRARSLALLGDQHACGLLVLELRERFDAMRQRAEDSRLHGRELALFALWLENNSVKAFEIAMSSLAIQKEPLDWWVLMISARGSADHARFTWARKQFQSSGLVDRRISQVMEPL